MQIFEDIRQAALGRVGEFSDSWPSGVQVPYRRIGVRQQQLFADAANENPEYSGVCAIGTVDNGAVDLTSMSPPVAAPERITKIVIASLAGPSDFAVGDEVTIIPIADPDGVPPRAYLRNKTLYGYKNDLSTVATVEMFYPYRPEATDAAEDGTREIEIVDPHSELLVVDLAQDYIRKSLALGDTKADILAIFATEESSLFARYIAHVREYAPIQTRFRQPPTAPMPRPRRDASAPAQAPRRAGGSSRMG